MNYNYTNAAMLHEMRSAACRSEEGRRSSSYLGA